MGPPHIGKTAPSLDAPISQLTVVSWNTAVGSGDVVALVRQLRQERGADMPLVLLLQEAYRKGPAVPSTLPPGTAIARFIGAAPSTPRLDIETVAAACGLNVYYAPSMRNGGPPASDEDRGNAVLSNLGIQSPEAIELPFERQRRVAVAATISGHLPDGRPWTLRVVSAHLDNVAGPRQFWFAGSESARARQARALVGLLAGATPLVLGGDFNTWFGFQDRAYTETAAAFHAAVPADRRRTFRGLMRLDHLFFRLPEGWRATFHRWDSRLGSDHYPLVATIDLE